jgi:hypothetical protein
MSKSRDRPDPIAGDAESDAAAALAAIDPIVLILARGLREIAKCRSPRNRDLSAMTRPGPGLAELDVERVSVDLEPGCGDLASAFVRCEAVACVDR